MEQEKREHIQDDGRGQEFEELVKQGVCLIHGQLLIYAKNLTQGTDLSSEDLLQETYLKLLQAKDWKNIWGGAIKTYARKTMLSVMKDYLRTKSSQKRTMPPNHDINIINKEDPLYELQINITKAKIQKYMNSLKERDRKIFELSQEGYASAKIAEILGGMKEATIRGICARVRSEIKKILQP